MTDEQRITNIPSVEDINSPRTFDEPDHTDIELKNRTKRTSTKQAKTSKQAHSSPSQPQPAAQQAQTPTRETPQKAKTRAERKAIEQDEPEETPIPQAPRKQRRTAHYVRIDDIRMNLARKFKEGI